MELTKQDLNQPFWTYADFRDDVPYELKLLVSRDRMDVHPHRGRQLLDYLHRLGFRDDALPNARTPIRCA
jgi:hypothetical protein